MQPAGAADNSHNIGSCSACHPTAPRFGIDTRYSVTFTTSADDPGLCASCHPAGKHPHPVLLDAGSGPSGARVSGYLPAGSSAAFAGKIVCTSCHFIHSADTRYGLLRGFPGSPDPRYFAAVADSVAVSPHFRRGLCFLCHSNTDDYALRDENVNALCDRCHASGSIRSNIHPLRKVPPEIPKGWPLSNGALTCLTCHDQGHEDQPKRLWMLRGGPYAAPREVCRNCHSMVDLANSRLHQEINEGKSCEMCHATRPQPGTDSIKTVSFIADPDLLCLRCHDQNVADGTVHHGGVIGREIEDGHIPAELPLFKGRVICATCHNPHLREATGSRLRDYLEDSNFCIGCHRA